MHKLRHKFVNISRRETDKQVRLALNRKFNSYNESADFMRLCYQFDLFILFWSRAFTLGKSQFYQKLNSAFFSN